MVNFQAKACTLAICVCVLQMSGPQEKAAYDEYERLDLISVQHAQPLLESLQSLPISSLAPGVCQLPIIQQDIDACLCTLHCIHWVVIYKDIYA